MTALLARETKGETILRGNAMILLHARMKEVTSLHFGILHLKYPIRYPKQDGELVKTAMVMLAPAHCSCQALETIGVISSSLLERWGLMEILHEGSRQAVYQELIQLFKGFYQKKYVEYLGEV